MLKHLKKNEYGLWLLSGKLDLLWRRLALFWSQVAQWQVFGSEGSSSFLEHCKWIPWASTNNFSYIVQYLPLELDHHLSLKSLLILSRWPRKSQTLTCSLHMPEKANFSLLYVTWDLLGWPWLTRWRGNSLSGCAEGWEGSEKRSSSLYLSLPFSSTYIDWLWLRNSWNEFPWGKVNPCAPLKGDTSSGPTT